MMGKNQIKENGKKEKKTVWTVKELMNGEYEKNMGNEDVYKILEYKLFRRAEKAILEGGVF